MTGERSLDGSAGQSVRGAQVRYRRAQQQGPSSNRSEQRAAGAARWRNTLSRAAVTMLGLLLAACTANPAAPAASSPTAATSPASTPTRGAAAASSTGGAAPAAPQIKAVATSTQIQDFVRNVGANRVMVLPILGPDNDSHDYQPTAEDARKVAQAEVIFANGAGFEPWLDPLLKNAKSSTPVVKLAEAAKLKIEKGGEEEPEGDPHVWQDPTNVKQMVEVIKTALSKADDQGAAAYQTGATAYEQQLDQLDQDIMKQWDAIPKDQRKLVTNHDAFGYYARRYGLTVIGSVLPSQSTEAEPSVAETQKLIQDIKAQHVKAIFTESNLNPRLEKQIAEQAGVKVYANLYGDALGPPGSDGDTYLKALRANTNNMIAGMR